MPFHISRAIAQNLVLDNIGEFRLGESGKGQIEKFRPVAGKTDQHRRGGNRIAPEELF